jgi:hypothetical protein
VFAALVVVGCAVVSPWGETVGVSVFGDCVFSGVVGCWFVGDVVV